MKKVFWKLLAAVLGLGAAFLYYYVTIPAFNIHSTGTWTFLAAGWVVLLGLLSFKKLRFTKQGKLEYE